MKHILALLLAIGCSGQDSPEERAAALARYNEKKKGKIEQKKSLDPSLIKKIERQREIIRKEFSLGCDASDSLQFKKTHKWYVSIDGRNWRHVDIVFRNQHENMISALDRWGQGKVYPAKAKDFARYMGACR